MSFDVAPIGPTDPSAATGGAGKARATRPAERPADSAQLASGEIPATPPQEVLDAVAAAGRRWHELQSQGRELRFGPDSAGRLSVNVHDTGGRFLRGLSPAEALDVANGAPLD